MLPSVLCFLQPGTSRRRLLILGLTLGVAYFIADYLWYLALPYTTVFVATAIFNSNCVFVFILSVFFLNERLTFHKVVFRSFPLLPCCSVE